MKMKEEDLAKKVMRMTITILEVLMEATRVMAVKAGAVVVVHGKEVVVDMAVEWVEEVVVMVLAVVAEKKKVVATVEIMAEVWVEEVVAVVLVEVVIMVAIAELLIKVVKAMVVEWVVEVAVTMVEAVEVMVVEWVIAPVEEVMVEVVVAMVVVWAVDTAVVWVNMEVADMVKVDSEKLVVVMVIWVVTPEEVVEAVARHVADLAEEVHNKVEWEEAVLHPEEDQKKDVDLVVDHMVVPVARVECKTVPVVMVDMMMIMVKAEVSHLAVVEVLTVDMKRMIMAIWTRAEVDHQVVPVEEAIQVQVAPVEVIMKDLLQVAVNQVDVQEVVPLQVAEVLQEMAERIQAVVAAHLAGVLPAQEDLVAAQTEEKNLLLPAQAAAVASDN
jgi:hypothetical protein